LNAAMKIQQFIEKYSLSQVQFPAPGFKPVMFLMDDESAKESFDDRYEFYANAEKTIWVSVNRTRQRFRICFCDLVTICSDWQNTEVNYELESIKAEPLTKK
jgi:hypothetical protein